MEKKEKKLIAVISVVAVLMLIVIVFAMPQNSNEEVARSYVWTYQNNIYSFSFVVTKGVVQYYEGLYGQAKDNYLYYLTPFDPLIQKMIISFYQMSEKTGVSVENLSISFVQSIPYQLGYRLNFPVLTLSYGYGDCGSKSILLATLLYAEGNNVILIYEPNQDHMLVGFAGNYSGYEVSYGILNYYTVESTAPSNIGYFNVTEPHQLWPVYYVTFTENQFSMNIVEIIALVLFFWVVGNITYAFVSLYFRPRIKKEKL